MENAKKNLVFHFGVGRQASSYQIDYVNGQKMDKKRVKIRPMISAQLGTKKT